MRSRTETEFRCEKHPNEFKTWFIDLSAYFCNTCVLQAGIEAMKDSAERDEARRREILGLVQQAMIDQRSETHSIQWAQARKTTEEIMKVFRP